MSLPFNLKGYRLSRECLDKYLHFGTYLDKEYQINNSQLQKFIIIVVTKQGIEGSVKSEVTK